MFNTSDPCKAGLLLGEMFNRSDPCKAGLLLGRCLKEWSLDGRYFSFTGGCYVWPIYTGGMLIRLIPVRRVFYWMMFNRVVPVRLVFIWGVLNRVIPVMRVFYWGGVFIRVILIWGMLVTVILFRRVFYWGIFNRVIKTASSLLFSSSRSSRIELQGMRERAKSGARTKKSERGGGEKQRKRWKRGDYRRPIVKKSARPLAALVFWLASFGFSVNRSHDMMASRVFLLLWQLAVSRAF